VIDVVTQSVVTVKQKPSHHMYLLACHQTVKVVPFILIFIIHITVVNL